jgi:UDP-3-O-[3-hydroxymyristoyl] N-acetylglucosamine deacetylase
MSKSHPILIVDDEEAICRTVAQILSDEGYVSESVPSGTLALEFISKKAYALVFLDIWMPGLDGISTLKSIKSLHPSLPVVMISGHATISTAVEATRLGAVDFIEKPFDLKDILTVAKKYVENGALSNSQEDSQKENTLVTKSDGFSPIKNNKADLNLTPTLHATVFSKPPFSPGRKVPQATIKSSAILYGQGLHSGGKSGLIFEPLPPNSGIHFVSVAGNTAVPAHVDYVQSTGFATTLSLGTSFSAGTIEHVMSALHAFGITNLLIKCNREVPVMDGSALEFCSLFEEVGLDYQDADWYEIDIPRRIRVGSEKEWLQFEPGDTFAVDYTLKYPDPVGEQSFKFELNSIEDYCREIAPARTFGFVKDIGYLQKLGLAQGGRFDNFILVGEHGVLNTDLRFTDEFVRHKILDVIGDLYLLGRKIKGTVTACMTGHSDNIALLRALQKELS